MSLQKGRLGSCGETCSHLSPASVEMSHVLQYNTTGKILAVQKRISNSLKE